MPVAVLLLWHALVVSGVWPRAIMATPGDTLVALGRRLADGTLASHAAVSLVRLAAGYLLGSLLGFLCACLVSLSVRVRLMVKPTLVFLALVPVVTWIPVLILSFGLDGSKIALIAVGAGGVVFSFAASAIAQTPTDYLDLARLHKKSTLETYVLVVLPSAAYSIISGMRIAMALCWVLLISSELIASSSGLGWFIWDSRNFSRPGDMTAGMVAVAALGALADRLLAVAQSSLNEWQAASTVVIRE
jgi:sulfonate transport system permease protein